MLRNKMKSVGYILIIIALSSLICLPMFAQKRILTIGDSTMADYDVEKYSGEKEMRGWGQMLSLFAKDGVVITNAAKNGRSSKSFHYEFWNELKNTIKSGDYVFIQFGHNDEKAKGLDTDGIGPKIRGTAAWGQYQEYLKMYIDDVRARGATPVLFTPIVRCLTDSLTNTISDVGMHNLTQYASNATIMNYPDAMRSLAIEMNVTLVDLTLLTKKLIESYGAEEARRIIYAKNDNTHLRAKGGSLIAELAVKELMRQGVLTDSFNLSMMSK